VIGPDTAQGKGIDFTLTERVTRKRKVTAVPIASCWAAISEWGLKRFGPRHPISKGCGICKKPFQVGPTVILFFKDYKPPNQMVHVECTPKEYMPKEKEVKP